MQTNSEVTSVQEKELIDATQYFAKLVTKAVEDPMQHEKAVIEGATVNAAGQIVRKDGTIAGAPTDYARYENGSIRGGDGVNYVSYENFQNTRKELLQALIEHLNPGNLINDLRSATIDQLMPAFHYTIVPPVGGLPQPVYAATTLKAKINLGNGANSNRQNIDDQGIVIHDLVKNILKTYFADKVLPGLTEYVGNIFGVNLLDPVNLTKRTILGLAAQRTLENFLLAYDNPAINNLLDEAAGAALTTTKVQLRHYTNSANINEAVNPAAVPVVANGVFAPRADEIADKITEYVFNKLNSVLLKASEIIKNALSGFILKADVKIIAGPASLENIKFEIPDDAIEAAKKVVAANGASTTSDQVRAAVTAGLADITAKLDAARAGATDPAIIRLLEIRFDIATRTYHNVTGSPAAATVAQLLGQAAAPTDEQKLKYMENLLLTVKNTAKTKDADKAKDPNVFNALKDLSGLLLKNYGNDIFSNEQISSLQSNINSLLDVLNHAAQNSSNKKLPVVLSVIGAGVSALGVQLGAQKDFTPASIVIIVVDVVAAVAAPLLTHYFVDEPKNKNTDQSLDIVTQLQEQLKNATDDKAINYLNKMSLLTDKFKTNNTKAKSTEKFASMTDSLAASRIAIAKGGV